MGLAIDPFEDHSPLIVDPYRVKFLQVALEPFQPVRRRYHQIVQAACCVDRFELALGSAGDSFKLTNPLIMEQRLSMFVAKRSDHYSNIPDTGIRSRHLAIGAYWMEWGEMRSTAPWGSTQTAPST